MECCYSFLGVALHLRNAVAFVRGLWVIVYGMVDGNEL